MAEAAAVPCRPSPAPERSERPYASAWNPRNLRSFGFGLGREVLLHHSILEMHLAPRVRGDIVLVSDQDNGLVLLVQLIEQRHDFDAGSGIQITGWLVFQNDAWLIH